MTKIMSNPKEPTVTYRHDYATEAHNESEEYPFMTPCNNDELVNHVLAREEEQARTGNAVDFLEMMANFKNEFNGKHTSILSLTISSPPYSHQTYPTLRDVDDSLMLLLLPDVRSYKFP